jgi:hypothetical protein
MEAANVLRSNKICNKTYFWILKCTLPDRSCWQPREDLTYRSETGWQTNKRTN